MAGDEDWVKLYRRVLESEVFQDASPALLKVFIWCLVKANYKPGKWRGTVIERGQFVTGKMVASEELKLPTTTWWRAMQKLESFGCISVKAEPRFTVVTVCKYESYQGGKSKRGTIVEPKWNPDGTQMEPTRNPDGTEVEPIEERKKSIKEEGKKGRREEGASPLAFDSDSFSSAWTMFTAHRTAIKKPLTPEAIRLAQKKLAAMGEINAILALENSVANGWQGIFEPKESRAGPASKFPSRTEKTLSAAQEYARRKEQANADEGRRTADCLPDGAGDCV